MAANARLGGHRHSVAPKREKVRATIGLVIGTIVGLVVFVIPGILLLWYALTHSPAFSKKQAAKRLHFFEHGMIVADHTGPVEVFRFDSMMARQNIVVQNVNGVHTNTEYNYHLQRRDGTWMKIDNFYANPERWGEFLQQEITRAQLHRAFTAVTQGHSVTYGDITMNKVGITTPKGTAAWGQIRQARTHNGGLSLWQAGSSRAWWQTSVGKVPNLYVVLGLIDQMRAR